MTGRSGAIPVRGTAAARWATLFAIGGLAVAVVVRAALLRSAFVPAGLDGITFAVLILASAAGTGMLLGSGRREGSAPDGVPRLHDVDGATTRVSAGVSAALGIAGGVVLVAVPVALRMVAPLAGSVAPARGIAVGFELWVAVTLIVSVSEELLLRGALFDAGVRALGVPATLAVTSVAFALMHVPFYGWQVVPLDFAVGLWLGGLRLVTGRVAAPSVAHAIADLAAWWL